MIYLSNILNKEQILDILNSNKIKTLLNKYNIKSFITFGSINTDEFYEYSDVDIAVISDVKLEFDDLITLEFTIQSLLNREIDIIDLNSNNLDLFIKINILNTGVLIHTFDDNFTLNNFYNSVDRTYIENENYIYFRRLDVLTWIKKDWQKLLKIYKNVLVI